MMNMEQLLEWELAGEKDVVKENPLPFQFFHHKTYMTCPGSNPCRHSGKSAADSLSYGRAKYLGISTFSSAKTWAFSYE
jgi:hypothetical protein